VVLSKLYLPGKNAGWWLSMLSHPHEKYESKLGSHNPNAKVRKLNMFSYHHLQVIIPLKPPTNYSCWLTPVSE